MEIVKDQVLGGASCERKGIAASFLFEGQKKKFGLGEVSSPRGPWGGNHPLSRLDAERTRIRKRASWSPKNVYLRRVKRGRKEEMQLHDKESQKRRGNFLGGKEEGDFLQGGMCLCREGKPILHHQGPKTEFAERENSEPGSVASCAGLREKGSTGSIIRRPKYRGGAQTELKKNLQHKNGPERKPPPPPTTRRREFRQGERTLERSPTTFGVDILGDLKENGRDHFCETERERKLVIKEVNKMLQGVADTPWMDLREKVPRKNLRRIGGEKLVTEKRYISDPWKSHQEKMKKRDQSIEKNVCDYAVFF